VPSNQTKRFGADVYLWVPLLFKLEGMRELWGISWEEKEEEEEEEGGVKEFGVICVT
jgi:hypothetical protein